MRAVVVLLLCSALAVGAVGCESTEHESARLGREGAKLIAGAGRVALGGSNRAVRVGQVALVHGSGRTAAAVQLTATGPAPQLDVPVLIDIRDPKGASVYRNDTRGLEPSLQSMPLLPRHARAWWVDDQVLASGTPSSVRVRIGAAKTPRAGAAHADASEVRIGGVRLGSDIAGPYLTGTVVNRSGVAQRNMPIFAVALRGGHVVAAGRALVPRLPASAGGRRPTAFRIYFVGSPAGARVELTPSPTVQA